MEYYIVLAGINGSREEERPSQVQGSSRSRAQPPLMSRQLFDASILGSSPTSSAMGELGRDRSSLLSSLVSSMPMFPMSASSAQPPSSAPADTPRPPSTSFSASAHVRDARERLERPAGRADAARADAARVDAARADVARADATASSSGEARTYPNLLEEILQRAFSQVSADNFFSEFVRRTIDNQRRSNPPASQFAMDNLQEQVSETEHTCTVCQDEIEGGAQALRMPCAHPFHRQCLMKWLAEHNTCPVCRCEIESHCPTYNQANFDKLKGTLHKKTISNHEDPSKMEPSQEHQAGSDSAIPNTRSPRVSQRSMARDLSRDAERMARRTADREQLRANLLQRQDMFFADFPPLPSSLPHAGSRVPATAAAPPPPLSTRESLTAALPRPGAESTPALDVNNEGISVSPNTAAAGGRRGIKRRRVCAQSLAPAVQELEQESSRQKTTHLIQPQAPDNADCAVSSSTRRGTASTPAVVERVECLSSVSAPRVSTRKRQRHARS